MTDNLRAAAQAALETLEDVFGKDKIDVGATALVETQMPTKICGPNLVGMLNAAGFYRKKEWVGLTDKDIKDVVGRNDSGGIGAYTREMFKQIEDKLREKNT